MTLDPAHPFLSIPPSLVLTVTVSVKCISARSDSNEEAEVGPVLF